MVDLKGVLSHNYSVCWSRSVKQCNAALHRPDLSPPPERYISGKNAADTTLFDICDGALHKVGDPMLRLTNAVDT